MKYVVRRMRIVVVTAKDDCITERTQGLRSFMRLKSADNFIHYSLTHDGRFGLLKRQGKVILPHHRNEKLQKPDNNKKKRTCVKCVRDLQRVSQKQLSHGRSMCNSLLVCLPECVLLVQNVQRCRNNVAVALLVSGFWSEEAHR